jgi:homoaconitase/3-isopropylmalate dehydratase large subunit/3-isopropylmalate dehydratase small subunit
MKNYRHTEFARERAQPGTLVIGSDSHTCSAGSMGSLAIGLGTADVTMPLITGETWFRIPESVSISLEGKPGFGIGGKDVILYILQQLKRNTVAAERVVEFSGPGLKHLSCDARFAIANMCTEFGGVTGIFVPDEVTKFYIERRKSPKHKHGSTYFRPDEDAEYAESHTIDLGKVESFIARYPKPDDVVPVSDMADIHLNGCFIGACTTAEEDLILAALTLEAGMKMGKTPVKTGKRKVVPGSLPIRNKLDRLGLTEVYQKAGFEVGVPGCSYCVGLAADKAPEGEVWLSSQNRNFENRMGPGSFGHITSAVTVAASSFEMQITDPQQLLDAIDAQRLGECLEINTSTKESTPPEYFEPGLGPVSDSARQSHTQTKEAASQTAPEIEDTACVRTTSYDSSAVPPTSAGKMSNSTAIKKSKVQRLGDFVDTDALAPNEALATAKSPGEWAEFCLKYTYPNFRQRSKEGYNIVVAGKAFGVGSSREVAVTALLGCKIQVVIAKSFAFIYGRNQPNLGLLGIVMTDPAFYEAATDGVEMSVDLDNLKIGVQTDAGVRTFSFQMSAMERQLTECGGVTDAWKKWGRKLWEEMCRGPGSTSSQKKIEPLEGGKKDLQW